MLLSNKQKVDECNNMSESQKLCSVKEIRHKNEHTLWFHIYELMEKSKPFNKKARLVFF